MAKTKFTLGKFSFPIFFATNCTPNCVITGLSLPLDLGENDLVTKDWHYWEYESGARQS
jgi:hypothetical protein